MASSKKAASKKKASSKKGKTAPTKKVNSLSSKVKNSSSSSKKRQRKGAKSFLVNNPVSRYLRGSWREIKKVTWPTRKEATQLTIGVVFYSIFFALFIAVLDFGLDRLFQQIILGGSNG